MINIKYITMVILNTVMVMAPLAYAGDITLEQAQTAIQAALSKAQELNTKMNIGVVDTRYL
ncbi:hypothetical protein THII_3083 [Thioploca ingrica]|uniref:Uncharacterized protein n=1 Tax=Thioploca ingrica TaxID=40754 RepID=A0A090APG1_9GAMM|nr:hypothetical protein THII_3083 [Thioploca ingrica]